MRTLRRTYFRQIGCGDFHLSGGNIPPVGIGGILQESRTNIPNWRRIKGIIPPVCREEAEESNER